MRYISSKQNQFRRTFNRFRKRFSSTFSLKANKQLVRLITNRRDLRLALVYLSWGQAFVTRRLLDRVDFTRHYQSKFPESNISVRLLGLQFTGITRG